MTTRKKPARVALSAAKTKAKTPPKKRRRSHRQPLLFDYPGTVLDYIAQTNAGLPVAPHPKTCPRCGKRHVLRLHDWHPRTVHCRSRFMPGVPDELLAEFWIVRFVCGACDVTFEMLPSFRGAVQAFCSASDRRLCA